MLHILIRTFLLTKFLFRVTLEDTAIKIHNHWLLLVLITRMKRLLYHKIKIYSTTNSNNFLTKI